MDSLIGRIDTSMPYSVIEIHKCIHVESSGWLPNGCLKELVNANTQLYTVINNPPLVAYHRIVSYNYIILTVVC